MGKVKYLTKSRFKLAAECPTKLYYSAKPEYKNLKNEDSFLATLAEGGFQVGELAKTFYPSGVEIKEINHDEAVQKTTELLKCNDVVIFEAAIRHKNLFVRVDVLVKCGSEVRLIEVKAKSYDSKCKNFFGKTPEDLESGIRPYVEDVAFQTYVLKKAFPHFTVKPRLMLPDKQVVVSVDGLNQLFQIERGEHGTKITVNPAIKGLKIDPLLLPEVNVDKEVDAVLRKGVKCLGSFVAIEEAATNWAKALGAGTKIKPTPGYQCAKCEFKSQKKSDGKSGFHECWREAFQMTDEEIDRGIVLDLWNSKKKKALIKAGKLKFSQLKREDLSGSGGEGELSYGDRQWMQVNGIPKNQDRGSFWMGHRYMTDEIQKWKFPFHFIDFETSTVALPFFKGMVPYGPVAFQFSHHILHQDGRVEHMGEFLSAEPGQFPNFKFAKALQDQLSEDDGTIFMWSKHENTILKSIASQLERYGKDESDWKSLQDFLHSLIKGGKRAMYDLCVLSEKAYFHPATNGRTSIKKVLPAVMSSSSWIKAKYSEPIYGSVDGIPSKNFKNFTWFQEDECGQIKEPYQLLAEYAHQLTGEEVAKDEDVDDLTIDVGGAAAAAYARLQFESMNAVIRNKTKEALKRYCELDTFAMVMIVQGWMHECHIDKSHKSKNS